MEIVSARRVGISNKTRIGWETNKIKQEWDGKFEGDFESVSGKLGGGWKVWMGNLGKIWKV